MYWGEKVKKPDKLKRKLRLGIGRLSFYIISLSKTEDQLDVFKASQIKQKFFNKKELKIVGIAWDYEDAINLVLAITKDVYEKTQGAAIKQYLENDF